MQITKPGTQRKKLFQAPAHLRYKHFSAALSPDLKKKHGANAIPVKVGDTVRLMRGDRKGFEGKIIRVDRRKYKIFVEGVTREKVDGTSIPIPIHPSKAMIISLDMSDKWRRKALNRKGVLLEKEGHPPAEAVEEKEEIEEKPKPKEVAKKPRRKEKKKREPAKPASKTVKKARKTVKPRRKRTKKAKVEGRSE
ncbi:50S ribosomal protein L24 [Candidatus Bathyarchaeota archaeon]|nr:50S ribosomal protein L24 [Candidatus Bathyarchaeota archaeon]